jgi:hypothetical protein
MGGAGDDTFIITDDTTIQNIKFDAGSTVESTGDTLKTTLATLDLTNADTLYNFEILDLGVGSTDTLLKIDDSFDISSGTLIINGDGNDSIDLGSGWQIGTNNGSYTTYDHAPSGGDISIQISNSITNIINAA